MVRGTVASRFYRPTPRGGASSASPDWNPGQTSHKLRAGRQMEYRKDNLTTPSDPHADQPLLTAGPAPEHAAATLVLVHGRGGAADDILSLHTELAIDRLAALAPQAAGHAWYPHSFLAPLDSNQPHLDS